VTACATPADHTAAVVRICSHCGEENPDRFPRCGFCGTPFAVAPAREVRKVVTVVFSDLKGSTDLGERLDSESLREVMTRYFDVMREALEGHGGTIEKYIGDAVMAVFGLPTLHEDDALRGVRAAAAMQAGLVTLNDELERRWGVRLQNRTGVNTGEVVAGDPTTGQRLVTGDAVNVAARLEQAAGADAVLLGPLTHRLVEEHVETEPLEPLELKGKSERIPAFRLVALRREPRRPRHASAPLVGRVAEMEVLDAALAEMATGTARLVTLLGPPGVGKSRLADEFASRARRDATMLRCRCLSYGRGITFWPLAELVHQAAGIDETDAPDLALVRLAALAGDDSVARRVAAAIGFSTEQFPVDELFWGARKLLERLARRRPLVLLVEDLHSAELTFLDLLEHVVDSADAPLLIVGTARHDLLELRPTWSEGPRAQRLTIDVLSRADTAEVVERLLGDASIPAVARRRIVEASDGNPLFAEQLLNMMIDEGLLSRRDNRWLAADDLEALEMPPSLHALLAARLDQLGAEQRAVIEPAAVVGLEFEVAAVRALAEGAGAAVETHLPVLSRKQLVQPIEAPADDPAYRFRHGLVREAAYQRLLKRARAELHERFAGWAAERYQARARGDELDEILGYHLEQAHRYLDQLGPLDDHARALGAAAAHRLAMAGRRAFDREDMPAAANLLRRASALLGTDDPRRVTLLLALGEAYTDIAEFALAEVALEEVEASDDPATAATATLLRVLARAQAGGGTEWGDRIVTAAGVAIEALEHTGDRGRAATAWRALAWAHGTTGRFGLAAEAADHAVAHAIAAGDDRQRRRASSQYAVAAVYGPTPVPEAIARCREILERAHGDRRTEGLVRSLLARLVAMDGDIPGARELYRAAQRTLQDLGHSTVAASTSLDTCGVEMLAGEPAAAERELRRDYEALEDFGERYLRSTVAGELVRALIAQGRTHEAAAYSAAAEAMAADDDVASQALWRVGRARLLVRAGENRRAVALAAEAVGLLEDTDALVTRADALTDQAEVLTLAGEPERAAEVAEAAVAIHERKGNRAAIAAARAVLAG
jgi:class 3 adenylate cyclase